MKNLVKLLIVVFIVTMVSESFAQTFGVKAGLNLSNQLFKDDDNTYSEDFKMNPGFHIGTIAEFPITEIFSFETGLLLSTKGFRFSREETFLGETIELIHKNNLNNLDIPLTAKVSFNVGGAKIYGAIGPYLGMGLFGKIKATETEEADIEWGSDDKADYKRFDFGLFAGAGVEINSIQIGLSYGFGLANISSVTEHGSKINNRVLGISVGYRFGGKGKTNE